MPDLEVDHAPSKTEAASYFQSDNYLKGYIGKDLVKSLLETSGYTVCHYGYEDTLPDVMSKRTSKTSNSPTGRRIRKSPDLLVYDDEKIMLTEVKTRLTSPPVINSGEIRILKEFWNDSILVLVVPVKDIFYAQEVNQLATLQGYYLSLSDFRQLSHIFTRVKEEHLSHYRRITLPILQTLMSKTQKESFNRSSVS
jgi:hypothetical protein